MNFYINQYFELASSIAKINKINENNIILRKISFGKTKNGYTFQQSILKKNLIKKLKNGEIKIISPERILINLLYLKNKGELK